MMLNKDGWQTCGGDSTVQKQSEELSKNKEGWQFASEGKFKKIFHLSEAYPRCYRAGGVHSEQFANPAGAIPRDK